MRISTLTDSGRERLKIWTFIAGASLLLLVSACSSDGGNELFGDHTIWTAVAQEDLDAIRGYAQAGGDLDKNSRTNDHTNLLIHAIENNASASFDLLLELGARPESMTRAGRTALHKSCVQSSTVWLETLISSGGDIHVRTKDGKGLLHFAITSRNPAARSEDNPAALSLVKILVENGADFEKPTTRYRDYPTASIDAAKHNRFDIALYLLTEGAEYGSVGPPPTGLLAFLKGLRLSSFLVEPERSDYLALVEWIQTDARERGVEGVGPFLKERW